jgi:general stress protein 26
MDKNISSFLQHHRISVLSVLQADGSIHSATLHYANNENPLSFFFMTGKKTEKCLSLLDGSERPSSLVVGFSEEEFATFQAEGKVKILDQDSESSWKTYIDKYPSRSQGKVNPEYVLLQFIPSWWRYTDMKSNPAVKITSQE